MLRKRSQDELGFSPDIVSAVGIGTPPCVSKELAEGCSGYVSTLVLQDDIIPRLSAASLRRLRNEILQTDWMTVMEKEDCKSIVDVVTNAKQVMSSVQDTARKLADYANFGKNKIISDVSSRRESSIETKTSKATNTDPAVKHEVTLPEELFVPGSLYFLKRESETDNVDKSNKNDSKGKESYTLWKRHPGEHFQKIVLSNNLMSDHKCGNHYYALRDVLKSLPASDDCKGIFR